jgi:hypothetical protein
MLVLLWLQRLLLQPPAGVLLPVRLDRCCLHAAHGLHLLLLPRLPAAVARSWVLVQYAGGRQGVALLLLLLQALQGPLLLRYSAWHSAASEPMS